MRTNLKQIFDFAIEGANSRFFTESVVAVVGTRCLHAHRRFYPARNIDVTA